MVDFNLIKRDYPKSFDLLLSEITSNDYNEWEVTGKGVLGTWAHEGWHCFCDRDLYEFFDKMNVIGFVHSYYKNSFSAIAETAPVETYPFAKRKWETRIEAEEALFEALFRILEQRLWLISI